MPDFLAKAVAPEEINGAVVFRRCVHQHDPRVSLNKQACELFHQARGDTAALEAAVHPQPEQPAIAPRAARLLHHAAKREADDPPFRFRDETGLCLGAE